MYDQNIIKTIYLHKVTMLSEKLKEKLMANWGDKAECLACNAEAKLYDPMGKWECYLIAINPEDHDEGKAIIVDAERGVSTYSIFVPQMLSRWNGYGDFMQFDEYFVPRNASALLQTLKYRNP